MYYHLGTGALDISCTLMVIRVLVLISTVYQGSVLTSSAGTSTYCSSISKKYSNDWESIQSSTTTVPIYQMGK